MKIFVGCLLFIFIIQPFVIHSNNSNLDTSIRSNSMLFHSMTTSAKYGIDSLLNLKIKIPNLSQSILYLTEQHVKDSTPTDDGVLKLLEILEFDKTEQTHILKLFKHESGDYKSKLTRIGNNLCGMRKPSRRVFLGESNTLYGYAVYQNWQLSVVDFYLWWKLKPWNHKNSFRDYLKSRNWN